MRRHVDASVCHGSLSGTFSSGMEALTRRIILRRIIPLLTAVATLIAVTALPVTSASASPRPRDLAASGAVTVYRAAPSQLRLAELRVSSSHLVLTPVSSSPQSPQPIPAQTTDCGPGFLQACSWLCLTNTTQQWCATFNPMDVVQAVIDTVQVAFELFEFLKTILGDGGKEEEPETDGEDGGGSTNADLCLQSTGGFVNYATCGSNGTWWIEVDRSGGGMYLKNRYLYDHGDHNAVLTVASPTSGDHLYVHDIVPGAWQNWSWVSLIAAPRTARTTTPSS